MRNNKLTTKIIKNWFAITFVVVLFVVGVNQTKSFNASDFEIGMKNTLISVWSNFRFYLLRDNFFNRTYTRDHKELSYIGENALDDYQNAHPFSDDQVRTIHEKLRKMRLSLESQGIKFYVVVPPNKATLYEDDLASIAPKFRYESRLDQLINYGKSLDENIVIDLRDVLIEASKHRRTYYHIDTHWNPYGAWVGYNKIIKLIKQDFPTIKVLALDDIQFKERKGVGDLASLAGVNFLYENRMDAKITNPEKTNRVITKIDNAEVITSTIEGSTMPSLLVYRDSFFTSIEPYISQSFSNAIYIRSFRVQPSVIEEHDPDIVIVEATERYIDRWLYLPYK